MIENHYKEIETLTNKENGPILVRHNQTKEFFVKKIYTLDLLDKLKKLQQINHPNLPRLQEIIPLENELWVYEEFIHGKNLKEYMLTQQSTSITTKEILNIASSVTQALMVLHERNIIHRDIKLTNIMISNDQVIKLIDFDAVRLYDGKKEQDTVNLGTMGYAAPEHFGFAETDERSDLYSLGVVLNVCDSHEYPTKKLSTNPYLAPIITKAIKLDPSQRFQTAKEMQLAIQEQLDLLTETKKTATTPISLKKVTSSVSEPAFKEATKPLKSSSLKPKIITRIPGFRSNIYWKKIIALFGYLFILLCYIILASTKGNAIDRLLECVNFTIMMIAPLFFFLNFLGVQDRLPFFRSPKRSSKIIGYLLFIVVWFIIVGTFIEITSGLYSPEYYK